jgi:hypothetical protein
VPGATNDKTRGSAKKKISIFLRNGIWYAKASAERDTAKRLATLAQRNIKFEWEAFQ